MKITDKDREAADELVEILTDGRGDQRTRKAVAIYLAAHRAESFRDGYEQAKTDAARFCARAGGCL